MTPATTITFWSNHPGSSEDITKQIISDFKNETGITVNLVTAGSSYEDVAQKFQTAQTGGTLPDIVVFSDVWWFRYYMQDSIIPLTNALKAANVDTSDYRDGLFASTRAPSGRCRGRARRRCSTTTRATGRPPDCPTGCPPPGTSSHSGPPS